MLKAEHRKAGDVRLQDGLGLEQVHKNEGPSFFILSNVQRGVLEGPLLKLDAG